MSFVTDSGAHRRQVEQLDRARRSGRVAHAYLFQGPRGVGKEDVALHLAQALNCTAAEPRPCGQCPDCRLLASGKHPDLRLVMSESSRQEFFRRHPEMAVEAREGDGVAAEAERQLAARLKRSSRQIRVEQLDELAPLQRHRPYRGGWKVVLVVAAHEMNLHCQNRFLKTLEEPSPDTVIVLLTHRPEALLPTVRSRCQPLSFGALPARLIGDWLVQRQGVAPEQAQVLAALGQGSYLRALELGRDEVMALRDRLAELLPELDTTGLDGLVQAAAELERDAGQPELVLELMEWWCRDLLLAGCDSLQQLANRDRAERLRQQARWLPPRRLFTWMDLLRRARRQVQRNANSRMLLERLLIEMRAA